MNNKLCLLLLITLITTIAQQTSPQRTTVVQGNHFYSNYQINTTYNIAQVSIDRSIIFILRKKDDNQIFDNNITVTLISGDKSVQCHIVSFNGMCYLEKLPTSNMIMKIRCDHLPCEASWTIMQPSIKKLKQTQSIQQMYDISGQANHMIAMVSCNNPQITNFDQLVTTYSQREYVRGSTNNVIYLLFKKQQEGHLYFKIQPKARACAQMAIYNVKQVLKQDEELKDFVFANESNIYTFNSKPHNQFQIDCSYHEVTKQAIRSDLILKLTGEKNGVRQAIISETIKPSIPTNDYEFSWAIPAISDDYSHLQVQARSSNNILIFNYALFTSQRIQIQQSQHVHFILNKQRKLKFKLMNQSQANSSQQVYFFLSKPEKLRISTKQCPKKEGCEFQIEALSDADAILYAGKTNSGNIKDETIFFDFKEKFTKKIKDGQTIYLKTPLKKDQVIQVIVNNPNVIVRASSEEHCKIPSSQCYEHIANSHHHFIYQPKNDGNLLFAVIGLDNCQFTLSIIKKGTESIELKDGEPFIYFMDDREKRIQFKFFMDEKKPVSFNLIAPLNDLLLVVNNGKQKPSSDEHTSSTDGYISFTKSELQQTQFRILVQKTPQSKHKSVHFTLIATTQGANLRLDPGIAHSQTLKPKQYKDFVFQFDKKGDYIVNFYTTTNVDKDDIELRILVNNQDKWTDNNVQHLSITENSDVLNLKDISEKLCIAGGDIQCEIFMRMVNAMKIEVDVTITLLVKDSVIELKDGLWQTYAINTIAKSSHFYFLPQTKNISINILYKSSLVDVGISYTIWKSDKQDIDPTQWPFPSYKQDISDKFSLYKSINHVIIDTERLQGCWPSCVVLISLYKKKGGLTNYFTNLDPNIQGTFSIMVANKIFQIPEKNNIQIMLKQSQQKYLMINLKYYRNKQALTFFTNGILGSFSLFGNVYSQKNPRYPTTTQHDFNFGEIETQIKMSTIESKITENEMSDDKDTYLCLLATAYLQSKFTIQFTSDQQIIKLLHFDTFERFELQPKKTKYFQLEAQQQYQIKFTREKGYFYVKLAVCNKGPDSKGYQECLDELKESKDRGKQIITKTEEFSEKPCLKCIVFIKVQSDDFAEAVIHVQSQYSMVQLKQSDLISDFTNEGQVNKYSITSVQKEETIISIEVTEGDPIVTVTDYGDLHITKQKNSTTNNILIVIPPKKVADNTVTPLGGVLYDSYAFSNTFRYLIVQIKSKNQKLSTAYTITYSSGQREIYMEDGMAVGYTLQANKKASFLYKSSNEATHGYITLSMPKSSTLYNLQFKMFSFPNPNDQDTKTEVTPVMPPMRKHTPNPTIVYSLPSSKLIKLQLQSQTQTKVTLMINHQQLIILPFNQQFPFQLHNNETINLLTDVNNPGYLLITLRKCDESSPTFGYTFDYNSFQKNQFEYTINLLDQPKFQFFVKASKIGTLYMQMNLTDSDGLFSINVRYNDTKIKGDKIKVGKSGKTQYKIIDYNHAEISFSPVICSYGSKCDKDVKYYWMASNSLQSVYTQTVCPYSFFQLLGITSSQPIKSNEIQGTTNLNGLISFTYNFKQDITYISIKAVVGKEELYYQPMEIITLWGSMTRKSKGNKISLLASIIVTCLCSLILYWRMIKKPDKKVKQEGYQVIQQTGIDD